LTRGEKLPGAVGTSAPVFGAAGIVGSLTVTIPEVRFAPSMEPRIQRLVVESAARISAVFGHRPGGG
jgi:DNA-binding IclR family transcriptional regulator